VSRPTENLPTRPVRVPFDRLEAAELHSGDSVLISGILLTARDAAHARMAEAIAAGQPLPFDPAGQVLYFVGPTPARPGKPIGSAGPTTASRMDPYSPLLIERGLRAMIGKGRIAVVRPVAKPFWSPLLERYWPEAEHLSNGLGSPV
jgi:tartrate dehydratase beta subunit/fumarate hydratase class I family protein